MSRGKKTVKIVGVSIDEDLATILLSGNEVVTVPLTIVTRAFPDCDTDSQEDYIVNLCANILRAEITFKGSDAINLKTI